MRLVWILAFVLLLASVALLISTRQSGRLLDQCWKSAANVLPVGTLQEIQRTTPDYAARVFGVLHELLRERFAATTRGAIKLVILRSLLLWHLSPAFLVLLFIGLLEGWWARKNQKTLIKVHSPMRFSLALTTLELMPVVALLWITAPMNFSALLLVCILALAAIFGTRNLIVHAPTQF